LATDDGWPRPLQAWKGEGKKMLLDKDKKRHSKVKEGRSVVFGITYVVDRIKSKAC
jgi:hypothetical protein